FSRKESSDERVRSHKRRKKSIALLAGGVFVLTPVAAACSSQGPKVQIVTERGTVIGKQDIPAHKQKETQQGPTGTRNCIPIPYRLDCIQNYTDAPTSVPVPKEYDLIANCKDK